MSGSGDRVGAPGTINALYNNSGQAENITICDNEVNFGEHHHYYGNNNNNRDEKSAPRKSSALLPGFGGKYKKNFKEKVNRGSAKSCQSKISDNDDIPEPSHIAFPQLKKVNLFGGHLAQRDSGYKGDLLFSEIGDASRVDDCHHFKDIDSCANFVFDQCKGNRRVALVGQAGSGKTMQMKRLAVHAINKKKPFKLVVFLNFCHIADSGSITPCELLFQKFALGENELYDGFKWLKNNQNKVVFFLDGLDQTAWALNGDVHVNYDKAASTSVIMSNILSAKLFPDVTIIMSSREHAVATLPVELRPKKVCALMGLTLDDAKKIFSELLEKVNDDDWNEMISNIPGLGPLCTVPVFLLFTAIVRIRFPEYNPKCMSEVMVLLLHCLIHSDHAAENIVEIISRLKKMAFEGMKEKRVTFSDIDLVQFDLNAKEVCSIVIKVPNSTVLCKKLFDSDYQHFFSHQSLQEILAALHVSEMGAREFKSFLSQHSQQGHWYVVLRFICGLLLNESISQQWKTGLLQDEDVQGKHDILRGELSQMFARAKTSREKLQLLTCIYESGDRDFIRMGTSVIDFEGLSFTPDEMFAFSFVMQRFEHLDQVKLVNCGLSQTNLTILSENLQMNIKVLDVSENHMKAECWELVGSFVQRCKVQQLYMRGCGADSRCLTSFSQSLAAYKICNMDLSKGPGEQTTDDEVHEVVKLLSCITHELILNNWTLKLEHLHLFGDKLKLCKIRNMDLSKKRQELTTDEEIRDVVKLLPCITHQLTLNNWTLTPEHRRQFGPKLTLCKGYKSSRSWCSIL